MNSTSKKLENKLNISKIAYAGGVIGSVAFQNWEGHTTIRNPFLGQWYDLHGQVYEVEGINFIDLEEIKCEIYHSQDNRTLQSVSADDRLNHQAMTYVRIIEELSESNDLNCSSFLPAFTALKACFSAGWKPLTIPKSVLKASIMLLNNLDGKLQDSGKDILTSILVLSPLISEEIIVFLMDNVKNDQLNQQHLSILHQCLDQIMQSSFSAILNRVVSRCSNSKQQAEKEDISSEEKLQLGNRIQFFTSINEWKHGYIVKINNIEGTVAIEYEDVDENNNSVIKLESILVSEASVRIQSLTMQPSGNTSTSALIDGTAIIQKNSITKLTVLDFFNNSESISKIISLAYLQVHGSCLCVSKREGIFKCTGCASDVNPKIFIPAKGFTCSLCTTSSSKSTFFVHCASCNSMLCWSCAEKRQDRKLLITLNSQEPCPVYRTMDANGEIISSVAPFSNIEVIDRFGSSFFELIMDGNCGCGYIPKILSKKSSSWKTVIKMDATEPSSCEYLGNLIRKLIFIDHLRKELILLLPSISVEKHNHLHELYSQVLESAYSLFCSNLSIIFSKCMEEQCYADEEDDILFSHDDKTTAFLRLGSSNEVAHSNILDMLAPVLPRSIEKIGIMTFGSILSLIILTITEYANKLIDDIHSTHSPEVYHSYAILRVIFASENRCILIPCFFRVMIAKSGLAAKRMVNLRKKQMASGFSVESCMESFLWFEKLQNAYIVALTHPLIQLTNVYSQGIIAKVQNTIRALGHGSLANQMIENYYKDIFYQEVEDHPFQNYLKAHILVPFNRFSNSSRLMRKFLRELTSYCSNDCLSQLEQIWRNLLTDYAYENMLKLYQQTSNTLFSDIFDEAVNVCKGLRLILEQLRFASRVDMCIGGITYMSSDFAFENAYRRLVRDVSTQFSRAICICLSSNLDESFLQSATYNNRESVDNIMDIIDVLFHKNSAEFQHFYEILLARRLIKCRAISHVLESNLISELPLIMKGDLMLHDIRQATQYTSTFRSHLLTRMDRNNIILSDETVRLILREKNFSLIVLTGSVWPSFLISPMHFENLRLPYEMQVVKEEFYNWISPVSIAHVNNFTEKATMMSGRYCQAFCIRGSKQNPVRINGIFFATDEIKDGWPIYAMEGNGGSILEYSSYSSSWQIKRRIDQGNNQENNMDVAYCNVEHGNSPEGLQKPWFVWEKETKTWVTDTIEVSEYVISSSSISKTEKVNNPRMANTSVARSSSGKRYLWCHGAGSVNLYAHIRQGDVDALTKHCMLSMSEPQAAIVMLFNSISLSQELLVDDIRKAINISGNELDFLLFSLTSAEFPLLLPVDTVTSQFSPKHKYSPTMRLVLNISMLESLCEEKRASESGINYSKDFPTVFLPSIIFNAADAESNIMNSDHLVLQGWRNDQIDACIVRLLKYAMRDKSGEFLCESNSNDLVALSMDTLCSLVRAHFVNEGDIPIETIVKRCERLVTIGVIDKLHGNKETLRSIAYCYTMDSNPLSEVHPDTTKKTVDKKVTGVELFDHLRIVLNIKSSGMEDQGISLPLLHVKFLAWMMTAKCDLSFPPQSKLNPLESLIKLLATIMDTMILQVNAAKLQYLHTFPDAFRRRKIEDTFLKLPGWQQLLNSIVESSNNDSKWPVLCLQLGFTKVFLSCLPLEVLLAILKAFGKNMDIIDNLRENWNENFSDETDDCEIVHSVLHPLEFNHRRNSILTQIDLLWGEKSTFSYVWLNRLGISQESVRDVKSLLSLEHKNCSSSPREVKSQSFANLKFPALEIQTDAQEPATDIKQSYCSSYSVSLSLEEFISVVFFQVSMGLSDSMDACWEKMCKDVDCSLASILHHVFFNRFLDGIAKMFDVPLPFLNDYLEKDDLNELGRRSAAAEELHDFRSEDENDMDNMIPCEFCSDNIPMDIFEVHVLVCQRGLHLPAPHQLARLARREGADVALRHAANWLRLSVEHMVRPIPPSWAEYQYVHEQPVSTSFNDSPAVSTATVLTKSRPQPDSPLALLLCQSIIDHLLQAAAMQCQVRSIAATENNLRDVNSMDGHCYSPIPCSNTSPLSGFYTFDVNFQEIMNDLFHVLDRDKDGVLTISDFTNNPTQLNTLNVIDPFLLYGDKDKKTQFNTDMLMTSSRDISSDRLSRTPFSQSSLQSPTRSISFNAPRDEDHRPSPFTPTVIPLHKSDSLRYSLSNEKSFPKMTSSHSYSGLNETEQEVAVFLERARNLLDDSESNVLAMLLHYKWDLKTLVEDYIENSRAVRLAVGLGTKNEPPFYRYDYYLKTQSVREKSIWDDNKEEDVYDDSKENENSKLIFETKNIKDLNDQTMTVTCGICGDTVDSREAFALPCCHWFCLICWEGYIETALNDRQLIRHCPSPECKFLVVPDMLTYFASSELGITTKKLIVKSFVEEKRGKRVIGSYCKNPRGCKGVVVMAEDANSSEAVCSLCATSFCAACDLPPHAPATCEMVAQWEEKGGYLETGKAEDAEARKLKHLTTKPCPKCGVRIEKNGGCPHMTCIQPNCKYQFCWECSGEYHTSSTCNRPKVKTDNNSILLFDELDRQCANYFLARKVAMKGKREVDHLLCQVEKHRDTRVYRTISEGWSTLAEAQSALAHTCIMMYFVKSVKIVFLYEHQKFVTQQLQQKFEEEWTNLDTFPVLEARFAIQDLQGRIHDYILSISAEIVLDRQTNQPVPVPSQISTPNGGYASRNANVSPSSQIQAVSASSQTPPRSSPGSPLPHLPANPASPSHTSPLVLTTSSLLPKSALLFESKKSPHRILQTARSRSGSHNFAANTVLRRQSSSNGNLGSGNGVHSDYYDIVDRLSTFSLQEKSDLASEIFGDAFGGSRHIYRALI